MAAASRVVHPFSPPESLHSRRDPWVDDDPPGDRDDCPPVLTRVIAREHESSVVGGWLAEADARLITITGPGGVGKTSLALHVARAFCVASRTRVVFVPLTPVLDAGLIPATIGRALGGTTPTPSDLVALVNQQTGSGPLLLVLDNFEHLTGGALLVGDLRTSCPRLRIVVTSRERLRLRGEREFHLTPLAPPPAATAGSGPISVEQVAAAPAARLLVERLRDVRGGFQLTPSNAGQIAELCRRLDGLPLALELAAARTRTLPLTFLIDRLARSSDLLADTSTRDQDDRHRTMTAVAAWSFDLLTPEEQETFRRLSVFPGAFPLDGALRVCLDDAADGSSAAPATGPDPTLAMVDRLASLVDKSLLGLATPVGAVDDDQPRYVMLSTLRQFGADRLDAAGATGATRRRHTEWVLASVLAHTLPFPNAYVEPEQFAFCEDRLPDIRIAMEDLHAQGDIARLAHLAIRMFPFWALRSYRSEGAAWCERIVAMPGYDGIAPMRRACLWIGAASLARTSGASGVGITAGEHARRLFEQVGDPRGAAAADLVLGAIHRASGEYTVALPYLERAVAVFDEHDARHWRALARCDLGATLIALGEPDRAAAYLAEADSIYRALGNGWGVTFTLLQLASAARVGGRFLDAAPPLREAISTGLALRASESVLDAINTIAALALGSGRHDAALRLAVAGERARAGLDYHLEAADQIVARRTTDAARAALGAEASAAIAVAARPLALADLTAEALALLDAIEQTPSPAPNTQDRTGADDPPAQGPPTDAAELAGLTAREWEVLALLAEGITDRAIGDRLFISPRTAMRHVANILLKLDVNSRTAAASLYLRATPGRPPGR